jgi:hypothetical protein
VSNRSVSVLCTNCGQISRRPAAFVHARRSFVCGGCKEVIPLDGQTILEGPAANEPRKEPAALEHGRSLDAPSTLSD